MNIKCNQKYNQGFTLVELLAVIVILSIIALIITPLVIGLIDNARKESFKASSYGIVRAGKILYSNDLMNGENEEVTFTYTNGVESSSIPGKKLDYEGFPPKNGTVIIDVDGNVAIALHDGNYCVQKENKDNTLIVTEKSLENCIILMSEILYSAETLNCLTSNVCSGVTLPTGFGETDKGTWIPVANKTELKQIQVTGTNTFGAGTIYEKQYTGGLDKKYVLVKNIDLNNENFEPIGYPSSQFTGKFDGGGFKIYNGYINYPTAPYVGLFARTSGSTIKNVGIQLSEVVGRATMGFYDVSYTGGLAGGATTNVIIDNVYVKTNIVSDCGGNTNQTGGIAGEFNGQMSDVYFSGNITKPNGSIGGIAGNIYGTGSNLSRVYAVGENLSGYSMVGGLISSVTSPTNVIQSSLALHNNIAASGSNLGSGRVTGYYYYATYDATLINNFANASMVPNPSDLFAEGAQNNKDGQDITLTDAKQKATYTNLGWDFDNIWKIDEGMAYPQFIWEK